jgi:hypothetical protein
MSMIGNYLPVTQAELDALYRDPNGIADFLVAHRDRIIDIGKAWHGIHFMLTGSVWDGPEPLNGVVLGGLPIGDIDLGYGPARGLSAARVKVVAEALEPMTEAIFCTRFDPGAMAQETIYPQIWAREGPEALKFLVEYFAVVRRVFLDAARNGHALILFVN